jgi:nickel transport protein
MLRRLIAGYAGPAALSAGLITAVVAAAGSAQAHAIQTNLEAFRNNHVLLLQSNFGNGEPAQAALVSLVPPGGQPIPVGRTNSKGQLSFALPRDAHGEWDVQVDGGPGHRDYLSLPINKGQADLNRISNGHRPNPTEGLVAWPSAANLASPWTLVGAIGGFMSGCTALLLGRHRRRLP